VVEGSIRSGEKCTFYLTNSVSVNNASSGVYNSEILSVLDAEVSVLGEDGTCYTSHLDGSEYQVQVGQLNPNVRYWLEIKTTSDGTFESSHEYPTPTPAIDSLSFRQNKEDGKVLILLGTSSPKADEPIYLQWSYEEAWEIYTPYCATWAFEPRDKYGSYYAPSLTKATTGENGSGNLPEFIRPLSPNEYTNHGWAFSHCINDIHGSSQQFIENKIAGLDIRQIEGSDNRLQTRYRICVHQRAITKNEYEYLELRSKQTTEMGGLFTPLPSELPTNIHCTDGSTKAIGYVGVSSSTASKVLYINRKDITFNPGYKAERYNDEECIERGQKTYLQRYNNGLRLLEYDDISSKSSWTPQWCIDCRHPYWGCTTTRPDYWEDK